MPIAVKVIAVHTLGASRAAQAADCGIDGDHIAQAKGAAGRGASVPMSCSTAAIN